ncbi:arabinose-5-phosphate isomerase [Pseudoxanthobacter soli DSM 19599]|uniref:Arabinose-5-phosphate isomerase n=1 Tax=Pseudoxanthobacter soli DSM 19599 TaxID=1123029 RepID=A0A1M7Z515_9HYPH|nr:KpsF/GutQ family sugar-phosphate isomerase [Pseudoxanthobacter soli]SHO59934.1 arabinose-5-phosphate isomerase [Pseudoxanthobacter soli DSM 19599]
MNDGRTTAARLEPVSKPDAPAACALRTVETEIAGLEALRAALANGMATTFDDVALLLSSIRGRVVVTGMGKSGHIGTKIAATMASTGTPAFFVHPAEASHGDLGMITDQDAVLALSWSGETVELASIISYAKRFRVPLVAITSKRGSSLGRAADFVLELPQAAEACPHGLAPTTSTMLQLALGDAIAIALLEMRGFTELDFRVFHPGGKLGANLRHARDLMHSGDRLPLAPLGTTMSEAILTISSKGFGCLGVTDSEGRLIGVITDGDLRRNLSSDLLGRHVEEVMSRKPRTIAPETLAASALETLNASSITALFVVEETGRPVGILHLHDLLRVGAA